MPNPIVHFEIMSDPGKKAPLIDFYKKTFDWEFEVADMGGGQTYSMINVPEDGRGIGGAVDEARDSAKVVVYIEVDDPKAYLEKVKANGGEVVMDLTVIPGMVAFAQFRDPAGNLMGIVDKETPPAPGQ